MAGEDARGGWFGVSIIGLGKGCEIYCVRVRDRKRVSYLVKIDLDATNVRGSHRDHAEEAIPPSTEQRNAFVEDKEIG